MQAGEVRRGFGTAMTNFRKARPSVVVVAHTPRGEGSSILCTRKGNKREQEIYQKRLSEN